MNHHLPHVIYGAVIGHFLMALWRKMLAPAPRVIVVPSKPTNSKLVPKLAGFPEPRLMEGGVWAVDAGLAAAMRKDGNIFSPRSGGWVKDPNFVEPPQEPDMPF